ncbi:SIS domain-containing protein [Candidatus Pelagibacter bacterium]|nr:SIS domain-containing protein [Candidatus Pelagibacter bacterium]MDA8836088.1 SIS domain-containing protein [Candidatus Pelagibacter bacterium]
MKTKCHFDNVNDSISKIILQKAWKNLIKNFKSSEEIFMIGNGGNWAVATHGAADITRLTNKKVFSLDSVCYATSLTNDYGYENIFTKWLENYSDKKKNSLLIAFSGSGNSKNIIESLKWTKKQKNFNQILISGLKSTVLPKNIDEISFNTKYFHTAEILSLAIIYEMIYQLGYSCPTIKSEIKRKSKK